jgi:hypothetical protein
VGWEFCGLGGKKLEDIMFRVGVLGDCGGSFGKENIKEVMFVGAGGLFK